MIGRLSIAFTLAAMGSPCGGSDPASPPEADATADVSAEDVLEEEPVPVHRFLLKTLTLPWELEPGVVRGFDLDDRVSDGTHPDDCSWEDFTAPDGTPGVDNQMARLTPLFEPAGLGQAFEYLENSIEDSGFFHLFELRGAESLIDDDSVELVYELGGGSGLMDPDGDLVAYQTMCVQNDSPHVVATEASIIDGVLRARFDALTFTFSMFERTYPFDFTAVRLQGRLTSDGFIADGVIGGSLAMSNILALVTKGAQNTGGLLEPMQLLLDGLGDMSSEAGPCTALSTSLELTAVPVFFYPPESDCDPCGNDVCEYFESCETCLIDCCDGCGNDVCDVYPIAQHDVAVSAAGFDAGSVDILVGDTVVWTNGTDGPINLICDDLFGSHSIEPAETHLEVATASGTFSCRVHEQPGQINVLYVDDNHSETCQSCPQDCGDCE
jgi:hypothetical protein